LQSDTGRAARRFATPRLRAALWVTAVGVVAALALGRPEPAAVAAPFALLALLALSPGRSGQLEATLRLEDERVQQGDTIAGELELVSPTASDRLELRLSVPLGLTLELREQRALALGAGPPRTLALDIDCVRWGAHALGPLHVRRYDQLRLVADEHTVDLGTVLRVYPTREALRTLVRPLGTQAAVGDQVARTKGEGIELAELRPFSEGDDLRRVNWRASARTGELVVNDLHPERNTAVVLLLDTFAELGTGRNPLDECVRAAVALAERYLARRDRVGLLPLGGTMRWLRPASGIVQRHRIVETLLEATPMPAAGAGAGLVVPTRFVPPQALVLALTPLLDDAVVRALLELRGRGFDVAVVELPPLSYVRLDDEGVRRLVSLERDLLRSRLRARGIAVVEWGEEQSLEVTVRAMEEFRRRAHVVRA
jgi:uncharacterized protein (DUF58 family)